MEDIEQTIGEEPSPLSIRATAMLDALGIPWGEHSALTTKNKEDGSVEYVDLKKDEKIARLLTNLPGVHIENGITSCDIRDLYKMGDEKLAELLEALEPDVADIIRAEYEIRHRTIEKSETGLDFFDVPINLFRLPGGVSMILRGYIHESWWHARYGEQLAVAYAKARIIGIEGYATLPLGISLKKFWNSPEQLGHYDFLMQQLNRNGFHGTFAEFDARNQGKVQMDHGEGDHSKFSHLFYKQYHMYLLRQNPHIASTIPTPNDLAELLFAQSTTRMDLNDSATMDALSVTDNGNIAHVAYPSIKQENGSTKRYTATTMTGLELGQCTFSDALSALKLHMTARLMAEDRIERGVIADFEGNYHTPGKSFFMRYPLYAAMVVLNNIHELMAGTAHTRFWRSNEKNVAVYAEKLFTNPDWPAIFKEITKLAFFDVKDGKLVEHPIDITPTTAIPNDKEVAEIMKKFQESK